MCETSVFIVQNGKEEKVLETATKIVTENGKIRARNIFGEEKEIEGRFKEFNTSEGKFIIEVA